MTWEETIQYIRTKPEYSYLVEKAYFEADLPLNVERFEKEPEFQETLKIIQNYASEAKSILDIGCGNGISAISFAKKGYEVTAVEPDPSDTIGAGAVKTLAEHYQLSNITVHEAFAEDIQFESNSFDVVYVRQAMHHANDLEKFIAECARVLKPNGLLLTIRDHVVFDEKDKEWFLEMHPLHQFYGGENAFSPQEYCQAFEQAGLQIKKELKYYDSVINYFPLSPQEVLNKKEITIKRINAHLIKKIGALGKLKIVQELYRKYSGFDEQELYDERKVAGRMYSYVTIKPVT